MSDLNHGDIITIDKDQHGQPKCEIDPKTRKSTGKLQKFRVVRRLDQIFLEPIHGDIPKEWKVDYPRTCSSPRTTKAREIQPFRDTRLKCCWGHEYSGKVRIVEFNGHDMDGDEIWHGGQPDYEPPTCVVCGNKTDSVVGGVNVG